MKSQITVVIVAIIALIGGIILGTNIQQGNQVAMEEKQADHHTPFMADLESLQSRINDLPVEELSQEEIDDLLLMREEEKLARDVYLDLYDRWGLNPFRSSSESEQMHMDAILAILNKYEISDPVSNDAIGIFSDQEFQTLYNDLIERGSQSEIEALKVGSILEELDLRDLNESLSVTDNEDITFVYENLARGSRNHLRSFAQQLEKRGESYQPNYISLSEYTAIIESEKEFCEEDKAAAANSDEVRRPCDIDI